MSEFLNDPFGKFEKHVLGNGIELYVCQLPERNIQSFQFTINAGHYHGPRGLAHFTEHIVAHAKGSGEATKLREEFARLGGSLQGGATAVDANWYGFNVPAKGEIVDKYLKRMGTYVMECSHDYDEKIENGIFLAERNERVRSPLREKFRKAWELAIMQDHFGADHFSMLFGSPEEISGRDPNAVREFYRQYYNPNNCAIFTAGPMSSDEIMDRLSKAGWLSYTPGKRAKELPYYNPPPALLGLHAFHSPEVQSATIVADCLYDIKTSRTCLILAARALRKLANDTLREKSGNAYHVGVILEKIGNVYLLELEAQGLQKDRLQEADTLYKGIFEVIAGPSFEETFDYAQQSQKNASLYEEFLTEDIPGMAHQRLLNYGKIISCRELSERVQEVRIGEVREILLKMHPSQTHTRWVLPVGAHPPAGVPLLDVDEVLKSLEK